MSTSWPAPGKPSVQAEFPPRGVWAGKAVQNVSTRTVMQVVIVCLALGFSK